jgi:hypothetical protein
MSNESEENNENIMVAKWRLVASGYQPAVSVASMPSIIALWPVAASAGSLAIASASIAVMAKIGNVAMSNMWREISM